MSIIQPCRRSRARGWRCLAGAMLCWAGTAAAARGDGYEGLARSVSRAAGRAGVARVAVAPFEPAEKGDAREGWLVAERLTTELVRLGQVQVVERNLLGKVFEEQRLMRTGAVDAAQSRRLGALYPVAGIVTGSFVVEGARLRLEARLIDMQTGLIVAAAQDEVARPGWGETAARPAGSRSGLSGLLYPAFNSDPPTEFLDGPLSEFLFQPPALGPAATPVAAASSGEDLKDSLSDDCAEANRSADEMESRILELKAHYWALRLKKGVANTQIKANPGSDLTDPELKRRFYSSLRAWSSFDVVPELEVSDVLTVLMIDHKASALRQNCRI